MLDGGVHPCLPHRAACPSWQAGWAEPITLTIVRATAAAPAPALLLDGRNQLLEDVALVLQEDLALAPRRARGLAAGCGGHRLGRAGGRVPQNGPKARGVVLGLGVQLVLIKIASKARVEGAKFTEPPRQRFRVEPAHCWLNRH